MGERSALLRSSGVMCQDPFSFCLRLFNRALTNFVCFIERGLNKWKTSEIVTYVSSQTGVPLQPIVLPAQFSQRHGACEES